MLALAREWPKDGYHVFRPLPLAVIPNIPNAPRFVKGAVGMTLQEQPCRAMPFCVTRPGVPQVRCV